MLPVNGLRWPGSGNCAATGSGRAEDRTSRAFISGKKREALLRKNRRFLPQAGVGLTLAVLVSGALANGLMENVPWQFPTVGDKWNKSLVLDQIEKKKGGYYDAVQNTYNTSNTTNSTTYVDRQVNCSVNAGATGNTGSNATTASTSSPSITNSGATNANSAANAATSALSGTSAAANGTLNNGQSNTGSLSSGVSSSNTSADTGPVTAGGGATEQALNSNQSNAGNLTASIATSTACVGPLN